MPSNSPGKFISLAALGLALLAHAACGSAATPPTMPITSPTLIPTAARTPTPTLAPGQSAPTRTLAPTPTPAPTTTPLPAVTQRVGILNVAQLGNPVSLTCWRRSSTDEADILNNVVEPVFYIDQQARLQGLLAEGWEMRSPNDWVLRLRKGAQFHDPAYGEMDASDVVASLDACVQEGQVTRARYPTSVLNAEKIILDDHTLQLKLEGDGTAALSNYFASYLQVYPKEYLEKMKADPSLEEKPVGTGPVVFEDWTANVKISGTRFGDYWGQDVGFDAVTWRILTDPFTRKSEFLTGGIDILPFVIPDWAEEIDASPAGRIESVVSSRYLFVGLPVREPPYNDIRVRQALNYAVNKQELIDQLFAGRGAAPVHGVLGPILPEADTSTAIYPYDPDKAMALLDAARTDGVEIDTVTLYAPNDRYTLDKETGEAVAGYWRDIGLNVSYVPQSRTALFPEVMTLKMKDPFLFGNGNSLLRAEYPFELWIQKREDPPSRGYHYAAGPDEWDEAIAALALTATGGPEATEQAQALDRAVTDYAPWVFLFNYVDYYGVSNRIDWQPYPSENRDLRTVRAR